MCVCVSVSVSVCVCLCVCVCVCVYAQAVSKVLDDKVRTGDIMEPGMTLVGCKQMGEEVAKRL